MYFGVPAAIYFTPRKNKKNRSPYRTYDDDAYSVGPGGDVYDRSWRVTSSYGRSSPRTDDEYGAYYVFPDGDVVIYSFPVYGDSCGNIHSPGTDWSDIACYLGPNGNIFEDINFYVDSVKDSYGFTLRIVVNAMIITAHIALILMEKLIERG